MSDPANDPELIAIQKEYYALLHAMQTGVAYTLEKDPTSGTPKHLRTGVNSAMCDNAALVKLLIAKGIITWSEYYTAIRDELKEEVGRYERKLREHYGANIKLY
jgi:hypothetical protein